MLGGCSIFQEQKYLHLYSNNFEVVDHFAVESAIQVSLALLTQGYYQSVPL